MWLNTFQRMLLRDLVKVFLLSLVSLTGLFLLAGLVQQASQRGLSPGQILSVLPLLIPNTLPYTIPTTTLFATCVVYGRLAQDNEYLALKAAGVNPLRVLKPAMILGAVAAATTAILYYEPIPRTHQILKERLLAESEDLLYNVLRRDLQLKYHNFPYIMFVREVRGRRLIDVIFKKQVLKNGQRVRTSMVARSSEATLSIDPVRKVGYVYMHRGVFSGENDVRGEFVDRRFDFPLPDELSGKVKHPRPMTLTWQELKAERAELIGVEAALRRRLADAEADLAEADPKGRGQLALHRKHLENQVNDTRRRDLNLANEQQMRPALAFGCVCFVLVGCPVGIWFSRSDYLSAFVSCFLPVVFIYYPLLFCGSNLGRDGKLPIAPAVWAADVALLAAAGFLTVRLVRR